MLAPIAPNSITSVRRSPPAARSLKVPSSIDGWAASGGKVRRFVHRQLRLGAKANRLYYPFLAFLVSNFPCMLFAIDHVFKLHRGAGALLSPSSALRRPRLFRIHSPAVFPSDAWLRAQRHSPQAGEDFVFLALRRSCIPSFGRTCPSGLPGGSTSGTEAARVPASIPRRDGHGGFARPQGSRGRPEGQVRPNRT